MLIDDLRHFTRHPTCGVIDSPSGASILDSPDTCGGQMHKDDESIYDTIIQRDGMRSRERQKCASGVHTTAHMQQ
jgi:hypothetical protein